jgi:hypothetical protein
MLSLILMSLLCKQDYQMQNTGNMVTRVQLLRSCDQSHSSDDCSEDDQNSVYLQVVPEEPESGLAAAEVLLQLQHQPIDSILKSEH